MGMGIGAGVGVLKAVNSVEPIDGNLKQTHGLFKSFLDTLPCVLEPYCSMRHETTSCFLNDRVNTSFTNVFFLFFSDT